MRLIVDTNSGLAVLDGTRDFSALDAVIIGGASLPPAIGALEDGYVSIAPGRLAEVLDLQGVRESSAFRGLVDALRRTNGPTGVAGDGKIRIPVAEWLSDQG